MNNILLDTNLKENCNILKPTDRSLDVFETLIKKYKPRGNRVYDIEIVSIMLANEIKKVATANILTISKTLMRLI